MGPLKTRKFLMREHDLPAQSCGKAIVSASLRSDNLRPVLNFFFGTCWNCLLWGRGVRCRSAKDTQTASRPSPQVLPWSLADGGIPVHARELGSGGGDPLRNHWGAFPGC